MSENDIGIAEGDANNAIMEEYSPALLGEIEEFIVTPYGTYGKTGERLLCGVILFGTTSQNGKRHKSFVLNDMTGSIVIEIENDEMMPEIPTAVLVIGTLERRNGINNVNARHVKSIPVKDMKAVGAWHTVKVVESIHADKEAISKAVELLKTKRYTPLSLMRQSQLTSNLISMRHVVFAMDKLHSEPNSIYGAEIPLEKMVP
jgi:hypothetical protein